MRPPTEVKPRPGEWIGDTYSNFAGIRNYRLYIPSTYSGRKMPLIVMLHGCKQTAEDFAAGTQMNFAAEKEGCFVVYPSQSQTANGLRCWNWFNPRNQHRGRGEPAIIAGITRKIMHDYAIDPERVYIAGLSAGGAMTAILAATYPDLYAAAGVHSGLARGSARNMPSAYTAMNSGESPIAAEVSITPMSFNTPRPVPMIVFQGDDDDTVHPKNSLQVLRQAMQTQASDLRMVEDGGAVPGGHSYTRETYQDRRKRPQFERWTIHGSGHAWSGGSDDGSYTDPLGPDATAEMMRFFLSHIHHAVPIHEEAFS